MRCSSWPLIAVAFAFCPADLQAQRGQEKEEDFIKAAPVVGDVLPDVRVYSPTGAEFNTADLRGHYTVLTFGCLT